MPEVQSSPSVEVREGATLTFNAINQQFSMLLGRVLTIVDAIFSDPVQRKAVKDLIKVDFQEQRNHVYNLCFTFGEDGARVTDCGSVPPDIS